ncbi:hypothetical protein C817_01254 [Dorea sp. 5-2]|nr:hypothetical protein C817_01254 [Dorea sp. 5-2]
MGRLSGKVALITGATKGIGETTAELFAAEGAKVVVAGRSREDGEKIVRRLNQSGGNALYFPLNVCNYEAWEACIAFIQEKFGKLHILVNNAGISYRETIEETSLESWNETIQTNQTGIFYGMKLGIEAMKKHGESSAIISTSSVDGIAGDSVFFSYCAAKAAVSAMTKCAALYCGEKGLNIRVNAVAPGYILTPMAYEDARQNGQTIEEYCEESVKMHPIGHLGRPIDIANAYLYLASDESAFVTGTTLMVDGGYTAK